MKSQWCKSHLVSSLRNRSYLDTIYCHPVVSHVPHSPVGQTAVRFRDFLPMTSFDALLVHQPSGKHDLTVHPAAGHELMYCILNNFLFEKGQRRLLRFPHCETLLSSSPAKLFGWGISSNSIDPLVICIEKTIGSNKHIEVESMLKWTSAIPPTYVEEEIQISTLRRLDIPRLLMGLKPATTISSFHPNFSKKRQDSTKQKASVKISDTNRLSTKHTTGVQLHLSVEVLNSCLSRCKATFTANTPCSCAGFST